MIKKFRIYVKEASDTAKVESVTNIIKRILASKLEVSSEAIETQPGFETVSVDDTILDGIRFFYNNRSFRINWLREFFKGFDREEEAKSTSIHSVTFFKPVTGEPDMRILVDGKVSIMKVVESIVNVLKLFEKQKDTEQKSESEESSHPKSSEERLHRLAMHESYIKEAIEKAPWPLAMKRFLHFQFKEKLKFPKSRLFTFLGTGDREEYSKFFDYLVNKYPDRIQNLEGAYLVKELIPETEWEKARASKKETESSVAGVKIERISPQEEILDSSDVREDPKIYDIQTGGRISYAKQLQNLADTVIKVAVDRIGNAVYVYGRGGTGKTTTVEKALIAKGKVPFNINHPERQADFETLRSVSPVELVKKAYQYSKPGQTLILDDADSIFKNTEGRNKLKEMTESNVTRVVKWDKDNSDFFEPNIVPALARSRGFTTETMFDVLLDEGKYPKRFKYEGCVICISNAKSMEELTGLAGENDAEALETRGIPIPISPMPSEFKEHVLMIVDNLDYVGKEKLSHQEKVDTILKFIGMIDKLHAEGKIDDKTKKKKINMRSIIRTLANRSKYPDSDWLGYSVQYI